MSIIYYFNPGHEYAIINASPHYMPATNLVKMQEDLSFLCAWYVEANTYVLVSEGISKTLKNKIAENKLNLPIGIMPDQIIASGNRNSVVHCWGISPQSVNYIDTINKKYHLNLVMPTWNIELKYFTSRQFATECLYYLIERNNYIPSDILPNYFDSLTELEKHVNSSECRLLAKAPYSSSGKGLLWIPQTGLTKTERQILHGVIKKQNTVSIEKVHKRIVDFAMEFTINNSCCSFLGYSLFNTNSKGRYESNYIGSQDTISKLLTSYIDDTFLEKIKKDLINFFSTKINNLYNGCIGVDMMICKENNSYYLHPCVEINIRDNMGIVAMNIYNRHIVPESEGYFYLDYHKEEGFLVKSDQEMSKKYPLICTKGRIKSGYFSLCPISEKTKYRAYILIH